MSDYKANCETGEQGELEVIEFLTSQLPGVKFIKFTSQKDQRFKGDYEMILSNEKKILIEIKTEEDDVWHNLFLEEISNKKTNKTGWMDYSNSELLFYYFRIPKKLYTVNYLRLKSKACRSNLRWVG